MLTLSVPKGGVTEIVYLRDGRTLLTGDAAGRVFAWDLPSQRPTLLFEIRGSPFSKSVQALCSSTDGRVAAAVSVNGCRLWDQVSGTTRLVNRRPFIRSPAAMAPDGQFLLALGHGLEERSWQQRIWRWDLVGEPQPREWASSSAISLAISADGRLAAYTTVAFDPALRHWMTHAYVRDLVSDQTIATLNDQTEGHTCVFSPDGRWFATGGSFSARLWDTATWRRRAKITHGKAQGRVHVRRIVFHPSGSLVATSGEAPIVTFWDTATGQELSRFDWGIGQVQSLAFSPDGLTCAAGGSNRKLVIWDVEL